VGESGIGGRIGPKIAALAAEGVMAGRVRSAGFTHDLIMRTQDSFFQLMGGEIHRTIGPLFAAIADNPDAPPWAERTFRFLATEHGQWQAFLANSAGGAAVSAGLIPLFNNELAPVTQRLIAGNPNFVVDVASAASMVARGLADETWGDFEARQQGLSSARFDRLVRAARHGMTPADVLAARNRGDVDTATAMAYLRDAGFTQDAAAHTLALRHPDLTPEQLADLVNFGVLSEDAAEPLAARSGMHTADFHRLVLGAGQAPALQELLFAYRRGVIDDDRLRRGLQQSPIRFEWFDVVKSLRFAPPPTEAALSAATQNLLPPAEAKRVWTQNGFDPDGFDWALESNGRPLGVEQAAELYNRGKINRAQATQMFLESSLKNKYVPLVFDLFERVPTLELTGRLVREGVWSQAQGIANLRALGFTATHAAAIAQLYADDQASGARELSVATLLELYEAQAINQGETIDALRSFGYSDDNITLLLAVRDLRRVLRAHDQAISRVRARYVAHRIDSGDAETALDALQVPPAQRDDLVDTWTIEREVNTAQLTTAQIQAALRRDLIDAAGALRRFLASGYDHDDAQILVRLALPAAQGG